MIVKIDKAFVKDTDKILDKKLLNAIADCIEGIRNLGKLSDIPNCKKLKGSKNAYRIRHNNSHPDNNKHHQWVLMPLAGML